MGIFIVAAESVLPLLRSLLSALGDSELILARLPVSISSCIFCLSVIVCIPRERELLNGVVPAGVLLQNILVEVNALGINEHEH